MKSWLSVRNCVIVAQRPQPAIDFSGLAMQASLQCMCAVPKMFKPYIEKISELHFFFQCIFNGTKYLKSSTCSGFFILSILIFNKATLANEVRFWLLFFVSR